MELKNYLSRTPATPFLELDNISVVMGDTIVIKKISVTINSGENIAILGPNGSGKSSLMKIITRDLYPVMSDEPMILRMWGKDQWNVFDLRSRLGIVSNDLQAMFSREITGKDVLLSGFFSSIGLFNHIVTPYMHKKTYEVADFLGIVHLMDRSILKMSSGESRRLLIGRSLVNSPEVLILDEPTNSLDLHALHILREYMRKITHAGIAIVLVTHQLHDIIPEITRVLLMKEGKIVHDGKKENFLTEKHIGNLFSIPVQIHQEEGYYYATGY
jgi:iron complex transport system ATP-binding protein